MGLSTEKVCFQKTEETLWPQDTVLQQRQSDTPTFHGEAGGSLVCRLVSWVVRFSLEETLFPITVPVPEVYGLHFRLWFYFSSSSFKYINN